MAQQAPTHKATTHTEVGHAPGGADEGVAASLGLNGQLFAFQLLNFAIVAVIVWYLILKPLTKQMDKRKKMIDESIDNAKAVETNLKMSKQQYQEKVDEAKVEYNKIVESSHAEAKAVGEGMKEKAKKDIELLIDQAKRNIKIEKEEAMAEVREEAGELVVAVAEKLLKTKLDDAGDKKIVEDAIKGLKG